jgi:S4 domain protein YaaA
MKSLKIDSPFITLGQLLKYADLIQSGGQAKHFIQDNTILLNGIHELRRGKKIYPGDVVIINHDTAFRVDQKPRKSIKLP